MNKDTLRGMMFGGLIVLLLTLTKCGAQASGGFTVQQIGSPDGSSCYVIVNGNGDGVGGNCK